MIRRLAPELLESLLQELLDHRLHFTDLPEPVLTGAGVRGCPPRQKTGWHRVGAGRGA